MEIILKNKIALIFAVFGALLALILSIISRAFIVDILIRFLIGAVIMGAIGFVLNLFLEKSLPEDEYASLMNMIKIPGLETSEETFEKNETPIANNKIDIFDKPDEVNDYDSLYNNGDLNSNDGAEHEGASEDIISQAAGDDDLPLDSDLKPSVISNHQAEMNRTNSDGEELEVYREKKDNIKDDFNKVGEVKKEEEFKQESRDTKTPGGEVRIKMGNKNVTVDPKVIAKAIKTIISRD